MKKDLLLFVFMFGWTFIQAQGLRCDSSVVKSPNDKSVEKTVNEYDAKGNLLSKTHVVWDEFSEMWQFDTRYEYGYDKDGNVILEIYALWNVSLKNWSNQEKLERTFDKKGKILSQIGYIWGNEEWQPNSKMSISYDENGDVLVNTSMMYDSENNRWAAVVKNEYSYNEMRQLVLYITSLGQENSEEFFLAFKTEYAYNKDGKSTLLHTSDWDVVQNKWISATKEIWKYDERGDEIEHISFFKNYETEELEESTKDEKFYDEHHHLITDLFYNKDTENNWRLFTKDQYTYTEGDSIASHINYRINFETSELAPNWKREYNYDQEGNLLLFFSYLWDINQGEWLPSLKQERTYNDQNRLLTEKKYFWNISMETGQGEWQNNYKAEYAYDVNGYQIYAAAYIFDMMNGIWVGQSKSESEYDNTGNLLRDVVYQWLDTIEDFKVVATILYYYSDPTNIDTKISVPANIVVHNGYVYIEYPEKKKIAVYDLTGRIISCNQKFFFISNRGCYIIRIGDKESYKIMIK